MIPQPPFLPPSPSPCVKGVDNIYKAMEIEQDLKLISSNSYNYHIW